MDVYQNPLKGALSHKDSMGNKRAIEVGEVQVMSAGTGLTHSEFNDSKTDEVNFLQIWIMPQELGVKPNYEQRNFSSEGKQNQLQTLVAPLDKLEDNALPINQQAYIYKSNLEAENTISLNVKSTSNGFYIFVVEGEIEVANTTLDKRDAIGVLETEALEI